MIEDNPTRQSLVPTNFNRLLNSHIGYGRAQQILTRALNLLLLSQGCETIALGLLLPVLTRQWSLSVFQQSLFISIIEFGIPVGSFLSGYLDKYGRQNFILLDAAFLTVFGLISTICWNFEVLVIVRFLYCVGIGICIPITAAYTSEISPQFMRGALLAKAWINWSLGYIFACALGWIFLQEMHWRLMLLMICSPGIYALIEQYRNGRESLHYLWVQRKIDQVYQLVTYMCQLNGRQEMNKKQVEELLYTEVQEQREGDIPLKELFNDKYGSCTLRFMIMWVAICFIYYGITLLLPTILQRVFLRAKANHNFKYIYLIAISGMEILSYSISPRIMNNPRIGRKKAVYWCLFITFFGSLFIIFFGEENMFALFVLMAIVKVTNTVSFAIIFTYTAEVYETMIRSKAIGMCSMLGRLSTVLLGMVGVPALEWLDGNGLYLLFVILSAVSGYSAYTMPTARVIG